MTAPVDDAVRVAPGPATPTTRRARSASRPPRPSTPAGTAPDEQAHDVDEPRRRRWWADPRWLALVSAGIAAVALHQKLQGQWDMPYFFDEMWRADMVRSSDHVDRMLTHNTPAAIGWILVLWAATTPFGGGPGVMRVASLAFFPIAAGLSSLALLRIVERAPLDRFGHRPARPVAALAAGLAPAIVVLLPAAWRYYYLNNYAFEVAYVAALTWAAVSLDRHRWAWGALLAGIAGLPLFTVGGSLTAPAFVACAAWWAWHRPRPERRRRAVDLAVATGAVAAFGAVVYLRLWHPITSGQGIEDYWVGEDATVGGRLSFGDLMAKLVSQAHHDLLGDRVMAASPTVVTLATLGLLAGLAVGLVSLGRRWPWFVAIPASAYLVALVGAFVAHWPITLERVNLCFYWMVYVAAAYGVLRMLTLPFRRHPSIALPAVAVLMVALFPTPFDPSPTAFARWMTADLDPVAASTAPRNVVLAYHTMAHFYAHDRLVNDTPGGAGRFTVVRDRFGDDALYRPVDATIDRYDLRSGDMVWCVIPYDLGPDRSLQACRFAPTTAVDRVVDERGTGTWIQGWRVR